jgi:hypothetical protein
MPTPATNCPAAMPVADDTVMLADGAAVVVVVGANVVVVVDPPGAAVVVVVGADVVVVVTIPKIVVEAAAVPNADNWLTIVVLAAIVATGEVPVNVPVIVLPTAIVPAVTLVTDNVVPLI